MATLGKQLARTKHAGTRERVLRDATKNGVGQEQPTGTQKGPTVGGHLPISLRISASGLAENSRHHAKKRLKQATYVV